MSRAEAEFPPLPMPAGYYAVAESVDEDSDGEEEGEGEDNGEDRDDSVGNESFVHYAKEGEEGAGAGSVLHLIVDNIDNGNDGDDDVPALVTSDNHDKKGILVDGEEEEEGGVVEGEAKKEYNGEDKSQQAEEKEEREEIGRAHV